MKKTKTYTLRILAVLTASVLLTGCGVKETVDYYNYPERGYCRFSIGDTVYLSYIGENTKQYHPGFSVPLEGLCRDPLCTHDGTGGLCPDSSQFLSYNKYFCTDGERIYFSVENQQRSIEEIFETGVGKMIRQIYSIKPDGSELTMLTEYEITTISNEEMRYHDGYLYYHQSYYKEEWDTETSAVLEDQYIVIRRISVNGGTPENVLPDHFSVYSRFFLDDENYYIIETDEKGNDRQMTIIHRDTLEKKQAEIPDGLYALSVHIYGDETFILCGEETVRVTYSEDHSYIPYRLYRYNDGSYEQIGKNIGAYTFSEGAFWYTPFEIRYYGTKDMPTGRGNETEPLDFIGKTGNTVTRVDLLTLEEKSWSCDLGEGAVPMILGVSQDIMFAEIHNMMQYYETGVYENSVHKIQLNDDGTVTDLGEFSK